jgi:Tol biopolymer transport system component
MRRRHARIVLCLVACIAFALASSLPAGGTFRGRPGKIAFSRSGTGSALAPADIWIAARSGGGQRRLTSTRGIDESDPVFSPGGRQIAYVRRRDGNADVWIMRSDGARKRPVATGPLDELQPAFYPAGNSLLFTRFDGSRDWTVFSIRLDGTREMRQLRDATFPVVSANARWLAYSAVGGGGGIRLRNLRSGHTRRLSTGSAQDLDFAPSSRRIVFTGQRPCRRGGDLRFAILSIGIRERHARILRRSCRSEFISPAHAPNGRKIVFAHKRRAATAAGLRFRLGIMSPGGIPLGGAPRHRRGTNELSPDWQVR